MKYKTLKYVHVLLYVYSLVHLGLAVSATSVYNTCPGGITHKLELKKRSRSFIWTLIVLGDITCIKFQNWRYLLSLNILYVQEVVTHFI